MAKKINVYIFIAIIMFSLFICNCSAAIFDGGNGTEKNPYLISRQEQLAVVADLPDMNYKLTKDIELTGTWTTIGSLGEQFSGVFDGDGHKIINASATLFKTNDGIIKNLSVENTAPVRGSILVDANNGTITNCSVSGKVSGGASDSGGIAASNSETGVIDKSSATIMLEGYSSNSTVYMGGIVGYNLGTVSECIAGGDIKASISGYSSNKHGTLYAGGIAGRLGIGSINNCYANVSVVSKTEGSYAYTYIGGIVGSIGSGSVDFTYAYGLVSGSYYYRGGICGYKEGSSSSVTNSFYNKDTTTCSDTGKGVPKSNLGMKIQSVYTDWDFENIWGMSDDINDGYPYLRWQYADMPKEDSTEVDIVATDSTDTSLKFISKVTSDDNSDISYFGTTIIPLSLFEDSNAKSVNVIYDNDEYNIQNGQTFGASLIGIPEQCKDWAFVGKSYIRDSNKNYIWSEAKSASINNTRLDNVN